MKKEEAVRMLEAVAARGFASVSVKRWCEDETEQYVTFTEEEKAALRNFLGENLQLARVGKHPLFSLFGEARTTLSLLERMVYAMGDSSITPAYVACLAVKLEETTPSLYEISELNRMMSNSTKHEDLHKEIQ